MAFRGKPVLAWSNLGLMLDGAPALGAAVRIESSQASSQDETWNSLAGKANPIRNHYNAVAVQTVETTAGGRRLAVEARAFDDGVAFRYAVPDQPGLKDLRITNEATQFHFPKDATTWPLILDDFQTGSEDDYHEISLQGLHAGYLVGLPVRRGGVLHARRAQFGAHGDGHARAPNGIVRGGSRAASRWLRIIRRLTTGRRKPNF